MKNLSSKPLNILLLCGGSGSGKSFISDLLVNGNPEGLFLSKKVTFHKPMQITTREKRLLENPTDYYFIKPENFNEYKEFVTAYTNFNNNEYGTIVSNLVYSDTVINVLVVSQEGKKNVINDFNGKENVFIETALILGDPDDGMINEHGRDINFFKDELYSLLKEKYDYYIPNYGPDDYCTYKDVLKYLGYLK